MTAIPNNFIALAAALRATRYKPCIPSPQPDGLIHISIAIDGAPAPGTPTSTLYEDEGAHVIGATIGAFALCTMCWEQFIAQRQSGAKAGV